MSVFQFEAENRQLFDEMNSMVDEVRLVCCLTTWWVTAISAFQVMFWEILNARWFSTNHLHIAAKAWPVAWFKNRDFRQIEGKVVEISRLQEIFADKVLEQEKDIDRIAHLVVGTTENVKEGNEQIREVITMEFTRSNLLFKSLSFWSILKSYWFDHRYSRTPIITKCSGPYFSFVTSGSIILEF